VRPGSGSREDAQSEEARYERLLEAHKQAHLKAWTSQRQDMLRRNKEWRTGFEHRLRQLDTCRNHRSRIKNLQALKQELTVRFMFQAPELMSRWSPEQRNALYRRLGLRVLALPEGGVEIEGIVELEKDCSTADTEYTPGIGLRR